MTIKVRDGRGDLGPMHFHHSRLDTPMPLISRDTGQPTHFSRYPSAHIFALITSDVSNDSKFEAYCLLPIHKADDDLEILQQR